MGQPPSYDASTHRLVWSLLAKDKGEADTAPKSINYNTYALGRDGYFSLNLLSDSERIAGERRSPMNCSAISPIMPASATRTSAPLPIASRNMA